MTTEPTPESEHWSVQLMERTRDWSLGVWALLVFGLLGLCAMGTLVVLFILTLVFGTGNA